MWSGGFSAVLVFGCGAEAAGLCAVNVPTFLILWQRAALG
jgi:hypothetical protein